MGAKIVRNEWGEEFLVDTEVNEANSMQDRMNNLEKKLKENIERTSLKETINEFKLKMEKFGFRCDNVNFENKELNISFRRG